MREKLSKFLHSQGLGGLGNTIIQRRDELVEWRKTKGVDQKIKSFLLKQKDDPFLKSMLNPPVIDLETAKKINKYVLYQTDIVQWGNYLKADGYKENDVFQLMNTQNFQNEFLTLFEKSLEKGVRSERKPVVKEAFELYKHCFFRGCTTLLYGMLEGVLTDFLVFKRKLEKDEKGKYNYIGNSFSYLNQERKQGQFNKKKVTGLFDKILIAADLISLFRELEIYEVEEDIFFKDSRNGVLHGDDLEGLSQERSFIIFLWLYYLLKFMNDHS